MMGTPLKTDADRLRDAMNEQRKLQRELTASRALVRKLEVKEDTAESIRKIMFGIAERDPAPPKWVTGKGVPNGERGGPVLMISDIHHGERVSKDETKGLNEFNARISAERLQRLFSATIDLSHNHMGRADVKYPGIVVCLGGDLIGGDIHEELMVTNDRTPQQAVDELTDLLAAGIKQLEAAFGRVFVVSVVGNHGRGTLKPRSKGAVYTNFDWLISCNLKRYFEGHIDPFTGAQVKGCSENVNFLIPPDPDAYFSVYGTRFLLTHGDRMGVKGGDGIIGALGPIARGTVKIGNSYRHIGVDFDFLLGGHYHQLLWLPNAIFNGCVKGYDEYARLVLRASYERPTQALFFVHPEHGITARWAVYLEGRKKVHADKAWVGWGQ